MLGAMTVGAGGVGDGGDGVSGSDGGGVTGVAGDGVDGDAGGVPPPPPHPTSNAMLRTTEPTIDDRSHETTHTLCNTISPP
jgi:hypothetical protein